MLLKWNSQVTDIYKKPHKTVLPFGFWELGIRGLTVLYLMPSGGLGIRGLHNYVSLAQGLVQIADGVWAGLWSEMMAQPWKFGFYTPSQLLAG